MNQIESPYSLTRVMAIHLFIASLKVILILIPVVDIFFEEAQYWTWSLVPDLSYYSKPPLIAYSNLFSTALLGDNLLGIRINAILCGLGIAWAIYEIAHDLYGNRKVAFYSSLSLLAFPYFWLISFFFTTDSLLLLFWTLSVLTGWRALQGSNKNRWLLGVFVGLGMLSKYTMIAFWPFIIAFAVKKKQSIVKFIGPLALSFLIFLPVIIWNHSNDWLTVKHLTALSTSSYSFEVFRAIKRMTEFLAGQLIGAFLFFPVILTGFLWKILKGRGQTKENYLGVPVLISLGIFLLVSINTNTQVNWTFFIYPPMAIVTGYYSIHRWVEYKSMLSVFLVLAFLGIPLYAHKIGLPSDINPFKRLMGWKEISARVGEFRNRNQMQNVEIITDYYVHSSLLTFYLPDHPQVFVLDYNRRMSQHDLWQHKLDRSPEKWYLYFTQVKPGYDELYRNRFSDPVDSLTIVYKFNNQDSLMYKVILFNDFEGFKKEYFENH